MTQQDARASWSSGLLGPGTVPCRDYSEVGISPVIPTSELVDDFALRPLLPEQTADLLEVVEDRAQRRSTIVASQLPVGLWHDALGAPTLADALLDRLVHNAHRIELRGESLRRPRDHPDADAAASPPGVADYAASQHREGGDTGERS